MATPGVRALCTGSCASAVCWGLRVRLPLRAGWRGVPGAAELIPGCHANNGMIRSTLANGGTLTNSHCSCLSSSCPGHSNIYHSKAEETLRLYAGSCGVGFGGKPPSPVPFLPQLAVRNHGRYYSALVSNVSPPLYSLSKYEGKYRNLQSAWDNCR